MLTVPANDLIAATYEVIKREQSLAASRGGLKSEQSQIQEGQC